MTVRLDTGAAAATRLAPRLAALVKIRAAQIDGCASAIDMHTTHARGEGETEQRIARLHAWREAPCYTDRERAALGWTEALTRRSEAHAHADAHAALKAQFTDDEQVELTLLIVGVRAWARITARFDAVGGVDGLVVDRAALTAGEAAA
jgi:AhpD family alkylhydroperoxidase